MKSRRTVVRFGNMVLAASLLFAGAGCVPDAPTKPEASQPVVTFKPQEMADALHAVIAADREVYARLVVQRLAEVKNANVSEAWKTNGSSALPAHLLRPASESVQQKGAEFHYVCLLYTSPSPRD